MKQLPIQSDLQKPTGSLNHQVERKIKPSIRRYCSEISSTPYDLCKALIRNRKTLKTIISSLESYNRSFEEVKDLIKVLKVQHSLSRLDYVFHWSSYFRNIYFSSKVKGWLSQSSLRLIIPDSLDLDTSLKILFKSLASFKNLTHFDIAFYLFDSESPRIAHKLGHFLRQLPKVTSLSVRFCDSESFRAKEFETLSRYLRKLTKLEALQLNFDENKKLKNQDFIRIAAALPYLMHTTKLTLNFSESEGHIQKSTLLQLFLSFKKMRALSDLTLNFSLSQIINRQDTEALAEGLALLDSSLMQKLRIEFTHDLSKSFNQISQTIKRFTSLSVLDFNLRQCDQTTEKAMNEFILALRSLSSLSSLKLELPYSIEGEFIVRDSAFALKALQNLVYLKLGFSTKKSTTDDQVKEFSSSLRALTRLQFLDLNFPQHRYISDRALEHLGDSLKELILLKNLSLNVYGDTAITNKGIEAISSAVRQLPSLSFWSLNVNENRNIDYKAIEKIAQALRSMPSLHSIQFGLYFCPKLDEKEDSMKSLFDALKVVDSICEGEVVMRYSAFRQEQANELRKRKDIRVRELYN